MTHRDDAQPGDVLSVPEFSQVIVAAGGLADTLRQMEGAAGRPLVVASAARPDVYGH